MAEAYWFLWLKKARELKTKYDHTKSFLERQLIESKPSFFGSYDAQKAAVLLCALFKVTEAQKQLYRRFVEGSAWFLSSINDDRKALEEMSALGIELARMVEKEQEMLSPLHDIFQQISMPQDIFSLTVQDIISISSSLQLTDSKLVKNVHNTINRQLEREILQIRRIVEQIDKINATCKVIVMRVQQDRDINKVARIAYFTAFASYFFGLIDYSMYSNIAKVSKLIMDLKA
ncbi:hypothetical protein C4573_00495 [Candidatus Woesearchaeota archaeon]|nr:MAG: hypothetical protein C4573_00495 [Candidatus Woesearchaeota archaeon]